MRTFTPDEANALVAELRPRVELLVEHKKRLDEAQEARSRLQARIAGNGGDITHSDVVEVADRVERAAAAIGAIVEEINGHGVQIKDLDVGLLDFPWRRGSEVVLLCWRLGENEIGYWHGMDEGYAGRKPL